MFPRKLTSWLRAKAQPTSPIRNRSLRIERLEERDTPAVVMGTIWRDADADGQFGGSENGLGGAVVEIFDTVDGIAGNANDVSHGVAATDSSGLFFLFGPDDAKCYLQFRTPAALAFTMMDQGDDATDSDASPSTGRSAIFSTAEGFAQIDAGVVGAQPGFGWALGLGGSSTDAPQRLARDDAGNLYVVGSIQAAADFDPGPGAYTPAFSGGEDGFIAKYTQAGALVWARTLRSSGVERIFDVAVDSSGSVFMTGTFAGTIDFDPGPDSTSLNSSNGSGFVWRLDADGNFGFATQFKAAPTRLAIDFASNVVVTGAFTGTVDFDPSPDSATSLTSVAASKDVFVAAYAGFDGSFMMARSMGGSGEDQGQDLIIDSEGNILATGWFTGTADFNPGVEVSNLVSAGGHDIFVAKLDSMGEFQFAASMGGPSVDHGMGIAVDGDGNIYTTGFFQASADFDPGAGVATMTSSGTDAAFVSKLNSAGAFAYAKTFSGTGFSNGFDIFVDAAGSATVAGTYSSKVDFDPAAATAFHLTSKGLGDAFLARLDTGGAFAGAFGLGGTGSDSAVGVAVDGSSNIWYTGSFTGTMDFDPDAGVTNLVSKGGVDVFLSRLRGNRVPVANAGGPYAIAEGDDLVLNASASTDPDPGDALTYEWDLNDDGFFGDAVGVSPTVAWTSLTAAGINDNTTGPIPIRVMVSDGLNDPVVASTTLTVSNTRPGLVISGTSQVNQGEEYSLDLGLPTDPGDDTVVEWIVHWGDGSTSSVDVSGSVTHTYSVIGPHSVTVDLVDEDGTHLNRANSHTVVVADMPPTIVISGASEAAEGAEYTLHLGAITEPGPEVVSQWIVHWGDGKSNTYASAGAVTHVYSNGPSARNITVDLVDSVGTHLDRGNPLSVTIRDVTPVASISGPSTAVEGQPYTATLGLVADPGDDPVTMWRIHWGDGSSDFVFAAGKVSHAYADGPADFEITVDITNDDGTFINAAGPHSVFVQNSVPSMSVNGPATSVEGAEYTLSLGEITDSGADSPTQMTVHWGDGTSELVAVGTGVATHIYADGPASFPISVDVIDEDGTHENVGNPVVVSVSNQAPMVTISGPAAVDEGAEYALTVGSAVDPGDDSATQWIIHWGDATSTTLNAPGDATHVYANPGSHTITVDVVDEDGLHADVANSLAVDVIGVDPVIAIAGDLIVDEGVLYTLNLGPITGPGAEDVAQIIVHWGDGNSDSYSSTGVVTHTYADGPNAFNITVDLVDGVETHEDTANGLNVVVQDTAPGIFISGLNAVDVGVEYSLNLGAIADAGADTVIAWVVHWGDGTSTVAAQGGELTHVYAAGQYDITVDLVNEDGTFENRANPLSVLVRSVRPTATISGPAEVEEGAEYVLTLTIDDVPGVSTATQWIVHWGDGTSSNVAGPGEITHVYVDGPSSVAITVDAFEGDAGFPDVANPLSVDVVNVAPTAKLDSAGLAAPRRPVEIRFTDVVDAVADTEAGLYYSFSFNDSDFDDAEDIVDSEADSAVTQYSETGLYTVHGRVRDKDGASNDYTTTLEVRNFSTLVTGAGAGGAPMVRVYDAISGELRFEFLAYEETFRGGVRVASGDVTGDGIPDVLVAPGPGRLLDVKVFDGRDAQEMSSTRVVAGAGFGLAGAHVAAGDVNGDGVADLVVGLGSAAGGQVVALDGEDGSTLVSFQLGGRKPVAGVRVAAGDVTGDGKAEIMGAPFPGGAVSVYRVNGGSGTPALLSRRTPFSNSSQTGVFIAAGDVDGDGDAEIIVARELAGRPRAIAIDAITGQTLREFKPFRRVPGVEYGLHLAAVDRDGDGVLDVVISSTEGSLGNRTFGGKPGVLLGQFNPFQPTLPGGVAIG